jgi:hypothetical protein
MILTLSIGDFVQYRSNDHRAIAKGTIVAVKGTKATVQWGTGFRAHKTTILLKNLTAYDADKAESLRFQYLATTHHCGVHGVSVSDRPRSAWECQFCGGVAAEIIDGNEHRARRKAGHKYAECVYPEVGIRQEVSL